MKWSKIIPTALASAFMLGIFSVQHNVSAKARPAKILKVVKTKRSKVLVSNGYFYSTAHLTKKVHNGANYQLVPFYSTRKVVVKKANGKKAVYQYLYRGKVKGWIWHGYVSSFYSSSNTTSNKPTQAKKTVDLSKYYTSSEISQIQEYQQTAKLLGNSTKSSDIYAVKPSSKGVFSVGQLTPTFLTSMTNWVNFFRSLYSLQPVTNNDAWNAEAQYGAAVLAAANQGLSHGLEGFTKPSFVSSTDWQRGAAATRQSNLSVGTTGAFDTIANYLDDDGNMDPGHREWLLGGISEIGIGQAADYNDLMVFSADDHNYQPTSAIEYPKRGLFPLAVSHWGRWSLSLPGKQTGNPTVQVHDNTVKKDIPVSQISISNATYGEFGTSISYQPDNSKIKLNHSYTISISGVGQPVNYTTKLFDIGVGNSND